MPASNNPLYRMLPLAALVIALGTGLAACHKQEEGSGQSTAEKVGAAAGTAQSKVEAGVSAAQKAADEAAAKARQAAAEAAEAGKQTVDDSRAAAEKAGEDAKKGYDSTKP